MDGERRERSRQENRIQEMITYPICPSDRLQRRLITVLDDELLPLSAFTGFTLCDDRENLSHATLVKQCALYQRRP